MKSIELIKSMKFIKLIKSNQVDKIKPIKTCS